MVSKRDYLWHGAVENRGTMSRVHMPSQMIIIISSCSGWFVYCAGEKN